jgi:hypothetical protein
MYSTTLCKHPLTHFPSSARVILGRGCHILIPDSVLLNLLRVYLVKRVFDTYNLSASQSEILIFLANDGT